MPRAPRSSCAQHTERHVSPWKRGSRLPFAQEMASRNSDAGTESPGRCTLAVTSKTLPRLPAACVAPTNYLDQGQGSGRRDTLAARVDELLREHLGQDIRVNVLRLDADAGHIVVSERMPAGWQLALFGQDG